MTDFVDNQKIEQSGVENEEREPKVSLLLSNLIENHLSSFTYTNQYIFCEGLKENVEDRVIHTLHPERPMYCYQHNEYFIRTLLQHGWRDEQISRRGTVVVNRFENEITEEVEMTLSETVICHSIIFLENKYILDVGFADNSLRDALEFRKVEEEVEIQGELYKFTKHSNFVNTLAPLPSTPAEWWSVSIKIGDDWFQLWRFPENIEFSYEDITKLNNLLYETPQNINIRDRVFLAAKVTPKKRCRFFVLKSEPGTITLKTSHSLTKEKTLEHFTAEEDFLQIMKNYFDWTPLPALQEYLNFAVGS